MAVQLMTPGRKSTVPAGMNMVLGKASAEEMREVLAGFASYFGAFDVDEKAQIVNRHMQGALVPSWVGADLRRAYRFSGSCLVFTSSLPGTVTDLIWEREKTESVNKIKQPKGII
jgi:hypothetical protein